MKVIPGSFYQRDDVVLIAKELLGKVLHTQFGNTKTSGVIIETEAYAGITDRASHAFGGRRTNRTEVMYAKGGTAYVYLCYGVHSLFNVVTNKQDVPDAVLIRAINSLSGMDEMIKRSGKATIDRSFGIGPGNVSKIMGIHFSMSGIELTREPAGTDEPGIWLEDEGRVVSPETIIIGPRIGVQYAGSDALRPYRFRITP